LNEGVLRRRQLVIGHRAAAGNATKLLHELDEGRVGLVADDVAPGAERAGTFSKCEPRGDAVAVPLLFAQIRVQARLELVAQDRVHHHQREVVGNIARRADVADCKS
jgi:hypothetical protein